MKDGPIETLATRIESGEAEVSEITPLGYAKPGTKSFRIRLYEPAVIDLVVFVDPMVRPDDPCTDLAITPSPTNTDLRVRPRIDQVVHLSVTEADLLLHWIGTALNRKTEARRQEQMEKLERYIETGVFKSPPKSMEGGRR